MNFYNISIFLISFIFLFKLPRFLVFENFKYTYYPIVELSNLLWDIINLREEFQNLILLESNSHIKTFAISFLPIVYPKEIMLSLGKEDGIKYGDVLTIKNILIGKIIEVNRKSSKAITIYNPNFSASIIIERSKYLGIFEGGDVPKISYITEGSDIIEGDTILTSSLDGSFPYGLFVGVVGKVIKKEGVFESREVKLPYKFERLVMFNIIRY